MHVSRTFYNFNCIATLYTNPTLLQNLVPTILVLVIEIASPNGRTNRVVRKKNKRRYDGKRKSTMMENSSAQKDGMIFRHEP